MKSLKITKKKQEEKLSAVESVNDAPQYPWGTRLNLEAEQVSKFPELKDAKVGDELTAIIKVRVKGVNASKYENEDGKKNASNNVELQITDMEFEGKKAPVDASKLYSEEKK